MGIDRLIYEQALKDRQDKQRSRGRQRARGRYFLSRTSAAVLIVLTVVALILIGLAVA